MSMLESCSLVSNSQGCLSPNNRAGVTCSSGDITTSWLAAVLRSRCRAAVRRDHQGSPAFPRGLCSEAAGLWLRSCSRDRWRYRQLNRMTQLSNLRSPLRVLPVSMPRNAACELFQMSFKVNITSMAPTSEIGVRREAKSRNTHLPSNATFIPFDVCGMSCRVEFPGLWVQERTGRSGLRLCYVL